MASYKDDMTLDVALAARMKELGVNQTTAAEAVGVGQPRLNKWLRRGEVPGDEHAAKLATFLGIETDAVTLMLARSRRARRSDDELRATVEAMEERLRDLEEKVDELLDRLEG